MRKKLAIRGHSTRGKEVIELLEMMGGVNSDDAYGNLPNKWNVSYYIFKDGVIKLSEDKILTKKQFEIFTLEDFLEKFPYKVGDKVLIPEYESEVRICEMNWDGFEIQYSVYRNDEEEWYTAEELLEYNDNPNETPKNTEEKKINQMSLANCDLDEVEIVLGNKFELKIEDGKYYAVRKKPKYPKTYEECCNVLRLGICNQYTEGYKHELIASLHKLYVCRDAYWKIYGKHTGLGEPWKPTTDPVYGITRACNLICTSNRSGKSQILEFPTKEMRDTFHTNFKKEIEQCKEFL